MIAVRRLGNQAFFAMMKIKKLSAKFLILELLKYLSYPPMAYHPNWLPRQPDGSHLESRLLWAIMILVWFLQLRLGDSYVFPLGLCPALPLSCMWTWVPGSVDSRGAVTRWGFPSTLLTQVDVGPRGAALPNARLEEQRDFEILIFRISMF